MNITVFKYNSDVSVQTLLRHHKITRWITFPCCAACLLFFSSLAQCMIFGFDSVSTVVIVTSLGTSAVLIIPAICCIPWIDDIEKELKARSVPIPGDIPVDKRAQWLALRLMGWAAIIVVAPIIMRKLFK